MAFTCYNSANHHNRKSDIVFYHRAWKYTKMGSNLSRMIMNYNKSLASAYEFAILLSTLACLIPYLFSVIAYVILAFKHKQFPLRPVHFLVAIIAFLFSVLAVIGSGAEIVFWGFVLLLVGLPLYAIMKMQHSNVVSIGSGSIG